MVLLKLGTDSVQNYEFVNVLAKFPKLSTIRLYLEPEDLVSTPSTRIRLTTRSARNLFEHITTGQVEKTLSSLDLIIDSAPLPIYERQNPVHSFQPRYVRRNIFSTGAIIIEDSRKEDLKSLPVRERLIAGIEMRERDAQDDAEFPTETFSFQREGFFERRQRGINRDGDHIRDEHNSSRSEGHGEYANNPNVISEYYGPDEWANRLNQAENEHNHTDRWPRDWPLRSEEQFTTTTTTTTTTPHVRTRHSNPELTDRRASYIRDVIPWFGTGPDWFEPEPEPAIPPTTPQAMQTRTKPKKGNVMARVKDAVRRKLNSFKGPRTAK